MKNVYFENYKISDRAGHLAAELARHLLARQYLAGALIVADNPLGLMCQMRKYWLRMARALQRERASTVNAEKILRLTYAITHMQHLRFIAKPPGTEFGHVFFVTPEQAIQLPPHCYTIYVATSTSMDVIRPLLAQLQHNGLVVDYTGRISAEALDARPKSYLLSEVFKMSNDVSVFLTDHGVTLQDLTSGKLSIDMALEKLQGSLHEFLRHAEQLQHMVELARPCILPATERESYEKIAELAYRTQSLDTAANVVTSKYARQDSTLFLRDIAFEEYAPILASTLAKTHLSQGYPPDD